MKKKIKSAVISIAVIAVLLLSILIGVKNGTLDKLTKEMPTLATSQEETEKTTVNDCKVSRQCDFDINRIDYGLENKKASMDSNNNFISDYYYAAVELEITKDVDDNETSGVYDNIFQTVWYIESLKDDGTHPPIKNAGTVGSDAEANQMGKTYFSFEKGETKKLILYCIFTDEEVENDTIALSFHDRTSPYIGPLAIIHEPGGENE